MAVSLNGDGGHDDSVLNTLGEISTGIMVRRGAAGNGLTASDRQRCNPQWGTSGPHENAVGDIRVKAASNDGRAPPKPHLRMRLPKDPAGAVPMRRPSAEEGRRRLPSPSTPEAGERP